MARIDYRDKSSRIREQYLYPERNETSFSDIAIPALSYLLFFTPPGRNLMGAVGKSVSKPFRKFISGPIAKGAAAATKKGADGFTEKAYTMADKVAGKESTGRMSDWWKRGSAKRLSAANKTAEWIEGRGKKALDLLSSGKAFPGAENAVGFIARNPGKIALGAGTFGALMALAPRDTKQPIADIGMGYPQGTTWVRRDRQPMRGGHLGATGDLVFALRNGR